MGHNEYGLKRQVHRTESLHTKLKWSHNTNLTLDSFRTNGGCLTQKVRQHEIIKISVEINKTRNERTGKNNTKKSTNWKSWCFEKKISKSEKVLPKFTKIQRKIFKLIKRNWKGDITEHISHKEIPWKPIFQQIWKCKVDW